MTSKEVVDELLRLLEIFTAAPVIFFLLFFLFRREIHVFLPKLGERLRSAEIAGNKFEFSEIAVNALQDAIEQGAEEYKDKPEQLVGFVRDQVKKLPEFQATSPVATQLTLSGRSILWVDDNPMNNVYEASVLKRLGASIVFARSTDEALSFLNRDSFDLIISDVHRNEDGRDNSNAGYELLEKVNQNIPLIFYTGNVSRLDRSKSRLAFGAADMPSALVELAVRALQKQ